jgi:hypothetical protein
MAGYPQDYWTMLIRFMGYLYRCFEKKADQDT